ncbi:EAL domain-containing protein [Alcaligenaceae bacterium B3P038]|nr:EAL domain-containing protein [Alcaligenaceae bacterium B3P038]
MRRRDELPTEANLRRFRIIAIASLLALIGAAVPIAAMLWITWSLAVSDEKALLTTTAERVLTRANRAAGDAQRTFDVLADTRLAPCSSGHIEQMRQLVFNTRSVEEIGYFDNGRLACTSWGITEKPIFFRPPDFTTSKGLGVTLNVHPALPGGAVKLALSSGNYNVLIDPMRFIDVVAEPQMFMGLTMADGQFIARSNEAPDELIESLARTPRIGVDEEFAFSAVHAGDWTAIALERHPGFFSSLRREQLILLPISLFIAGLIVLMVVWQSRQRLSFRSEIATAIRNNEFEVHYQPIIDVASGHCVGAEALARWRRPDGSWVRPDLFITVAEDTGLIGDITALVIEHVGRDLGAMLARDPSLHVAINLAPDDLKTDVVLNRLDALIANHAMAPAQVWLEVTERGFMDYDSARDIIAEARAKGYRLSIDDFGTGYSSLTHLQQITFDALKIDKSFVDTIGVPSAKSAVIFHIIEMAKALGVSIIAEGVEHQAQADYLRANGVGLAQGWLYARALPAGEFAAYLSDVRRAPPAGSAIVDNG